MPALWSYRRGVAREAETLKTGPRGRGSESPPHRETPVLPRTQVQVVKPAGCRSPYLPLLLRSSAQDAARYSRRAPTMCLPPFPRPFSSSRWGQSATCGSVRFQALALVLRRHADSELNGRFGQHPSQFHNSAVPRACAAAHARGRSRTFLTRLHVLESAPTPKFPFSHCMDRADPKLMHGDVCPGLLPRPLGLGYDRQNVGYPITAAHLTLRPPIATLD